MEFSNEGGNIILAVNREVSDSVRELAESFGFNLDKKGTEVIDHFSKAVSVDLRYYFEVFFGPYYVIISSASSILTFSPRISFIRRVFLELMQFPR